MTKNINLFLHYSYSNYTKGLVTTTTNEIVRKFICQLAHPPVLWCSVVGCVAHGNKQLYYYRIISVYCLWPLPHLVLVCTTVVCVLFVAAPTSTISVYYLSMSTVCVHSHV